MKDAPPHDAIANRLEEGLTKSDLDFIKNQFARYVVEHGIDIRKFKPSKKDHVDSFIEHLEHESLTWSGLPHIDEIWDETPIHHLKNTLKNLLLNDGAPIASKVEFYRKVKDEAADEQSQS